MKRGSKVEGDCLGMSPIIRGGLRVVGQRQRSAVATFGMYIRRRVRVTSGELL